MLDSKWDKIRFLLEKNLTVGNSLKLELKVRRHSDVTVNLK